jgi:acetyl-CoA carboxylase biotin carboxyl carrier protein
MSVLDVPSPMAGSIKEMLVSTGDDVHEGQEIVVLESMKMEIPVESPATGTIAETLVSAPQQIAEGQILLRIEIS